MTDAEPTSRAAVLTVAGSDSGGGAGVQADLKAFYVFGVFGTSALTAVTAQNPRGVRKVQALEPALLREQLEAVLETFDIRAAKTGMLFSREHILQVAAAFRARPDIPLVVDPVMVATSGARLLQRDAVDTLRSELLPLASVATPNLAEAGILLKQLPLPAADPQTARKLAEACGSAVLLKGGHADDAQASDILWQCGRGWWLRSGVAGIEDAAAHGTGCSLSAALAAALAGGKSLLEAAHAAKAYVWGALNHAVRVGDSLRSMWPVLPLPLEDIRVEEIGERAPADLRGRQ